MVELPEWVPEGVDITVPNAARMYDYALGGYHNFAVDREYADKVEQAAPGSIAMGYANRAFVGRSVRWLLDQGIRQFLDIGSGIPTLGNVHEVAQAVAPDTRVLYVDIDPVAVAHSRAILAGNARAGIIRADLCRPADILYHPEVTDLLDFGEPVAVLLNAVLHFVPDSADPEGILAQIREALVRDSYVSMTHGTFVDVEAESVEGLRQVYRQTPTAIHVRTAERILGLFDGMTVIEPGAVPVNRWRPDPDAQEEDTVKAILAVVGRKI